MKRISYDRRCAARRIGCAAVSLSLCAVLGCGCAVLPAASEPAASSAVDTIPTDANGQPLYDSTLLQDGQLRTLYSRGSSGVILCGSKVVCTFSSSENVSLVEDSATGETNYFFRTWSDSTGRGGRRSALYDKTGTEVRAFDGEWSATLNHGLLVLREDQLVDGKYTGDYSGYGSCQVIDLSSGESLTVPENAYNCFVCGDLLVFNCYARPADLDADTWDEDHGLHSWVLVQNQDGSTLHRIDAAQSYDLSYYSSGLPEGWIELDTYRTDSADGDNTISVLYSPATGEELSGFIQYCGNGAACFRTEDYRYELRDLTAEGCPVLNTFDGQVSYYFSGYAVLWRTDDDFRYELQDLVSGKTYPLYAASVTNNDIALYFEDGRLQMFDMTTGDLLMNTTVEPVANQQSILMNCEGDGYVWLELRDNDTYDTTATRVYGPEGLVSDLTPLQSTYESLNYLTTTPEGKPMYYGTRPATGSAYSSVNDVLDADGNVVISGLASCYGYYSNSLNGLPEHVFSAQRGFYQGWMDTTGRWVYCCSIFSSLDDDDQLLW